MVLNIFYRTINKEFILLKMTEAKTEEFCIRSITSAILFSLKSFLAFLLLFYT